MINWNARARLEEAVTLGEGWTCNSPSPVYGTSPIAILVRQRCRGSDSRSVLLIARRNDLS